ncbi:MAG: phosphatidylserine/phosphatidylglycerophosphate/cardiolipin synthase family protein [Candidatus Limnocylindrales bacterium]
MKTRMLLGVTALGGAWILRKRLAAGRRTAFPPGPLALRAGDARAYAEIVAGRRRPEKRDLAISFASSTATDVEPLLHGTHYFPRMLADIEAASSSIHLLMYGFQPGEIGTKFRDALVARANQGVEVRLCVDEIGSAVHFGSRQLYGDLTAAGVQVVVNQGLFLDVEGVLGGRHWIDWRLDDFTHFDHRKMLIVDGRLAYVGGTGIEDHYNDERFYDAMVRLEGPVVAQLQALFLATFRLHDGRLSTDPAALDHLFPALDDGGRGVPATVLANVPGEGHHPISDAIELLLEEAQERIDIVNPYITDHAILDRLQDAADRGVRVRIIAPGKPTPPYPAAAFRHHYGRLISSGVTIFLHPAMAHAKVVRVDDRVLVGGCNLDGLSLYRNLELNVLLEGAATAEAFEREILEPLAAMSTPATVPTDPRERRWNAAMDAVSRFL